MTDSASYRWARKALPWFCLLLVQLGAVHALEASAARMPVPMYEASASGSADGGCVDMDERVDVNVLVAMQTDQLQYLQASLCPSGNVEAQDVYLRRPHRY